MSAVLLGSVPPLKRCANESETLSVLGDSQISDLISVPASSSAAEREHDAAVSGCFVVSMDVLTRLLLVLLVSSKLKIGSGSCHKCYCDGYRHFTAFPRSRLEQSYSCCPSTRSFVNLLHQWAP